MGMVLNKRLVKFYYINLLFYICINKRQLDCMLFENMWVTGKTGYSRLL